MTEPVENTEEKVERPDERITVTVKMPGGSEPEPKEIFMSAGLVRRLATVVQSLGDISQMYSDPMVEDILLTEILTPRTERGKSQKIYTAEDFEMAMDEADRLLEWARGHVLHFFTKTVLRVGTVASNPNSPLLKLTQSLSGLAALAQQKHSAGATDAKSVT